MSAHSVDAIRRALDGDIPAALATSAADGTPNITLISQVQYVDAGHVALSYQFFNKTRENILANPFASVEVIDPVSGAVHQLALNYLRTETSGALFENMKAKLAGIASHTGMAAVFRLLGADVYRVLNLREIAGPALPEAPRRNLLAAVRTASAHLAEPGNTDSLLDRLMADLHDLFGIEHAMLLMQDETARTLYTVASRGYASSGVGSEIALGQGVIGVAAREKTPIRITHFAADYVYSRAMAESGGLELEDRIPLPGLAGPHSQLAVPVMAQDRLLGILFAESGQDQFFGYDEEDALVAVASQLGLALALQPEPVDEGTPARSIQPPPGGSVMVIRHYPADGSVFIDEDYFIKGVAGAIFWKLLREYAGGRQGDFTNRELRLDPTLKLPAFSENLEARLILLQRRLAERSEHMRMEKTGRGRFRLVVRRPIKLMEVSKPL